MSIDWVHFVPLFVAIAIYLIGMLAYNATKKDSE